MIELLGDDAVHLRLGEDAEGDEGLELGAGDVPLLIATLEGTPLDDDDALPAGLERGGEEYAERPAAHGDVVVAGAPDRLARLGHERGGGAGGVALGHVSDGGPRRVDTLERAEGGPAAGATGLLATLGPLDALEKTTRAIGDGHRLGTARRGSADGGRDARGDPHGARGWTQTGATTLARAMAADMFVSMPRARLCDVVRSDNAPAGKREDDDFILVPASSSSPSSSRTADTRRRTADDDDADQPRRHPVGTPDGGGALGSRGRRGEA